MAHVQLDIQADGGPAARPRGRSRDRSTSEEPALAVLVSVAALRCESPVRFGSPDSKHISALAEVADRWPPILVAADTMVVLDGIHRVAAARLLGRSSIQAHLFVGNEIDQFAAAVRRNVEHGLPLSRSERLSAANRLLAGQPPRSDRAVAEICGLDHKTVARLRQDIPRRISDTPEMDSRIGRDHRARPVDPVAKRERIAEAIALAPGDSLRQIARRVGASPETVRDVRARLARGEDPVSSPKAQSLFPPALPEAVRTWVADSACLSASDCADFASWFDDAGEALRWRSYVPVVPLGRVYEVADQARIYAQAWRDFAEALEIRTRSGRSRP